jgi:hypothetical protein
MSARLMQACAIVGALLAGPPPVVADETVGCVQAGLQSRGYDAGSIDGTLNLDTIRAAEVFAAAAMFPMPPLTLATAPEWCHLLRAWADLSPTNLDAPGFANINPGALPLGIFFDVTVSMDVRQLILGDLLWLAGLGELEASAEVATLLGLGYSVTGSDLVAWLLLHLRGVSVTQPCLGSPTVLVDDTALNGADPTKVGIEVFQRCDGTLGGYWGFVDENPYSPRLIARYYDDHILYTRGETIPVIYLGDLFIQNLNVEGFLARTSRLITLFHEGYHIAGAPDHATCSHLNLLSRTDAFGRRGTVLNTVGRNCDVGTRSAYYLEGLMADLLLANCAICTAAETDEIRDLAIRAFMRVQLPLTSAQLVEDNELFDGRNEIEVRIQFIPPHQFFERQADEFVDAIGQVPPWFVELQTIAERLAVARDNVDERRVPPVVVNTDLAMAWLLRAHRSFERGYNVPLVGAPNCEQTPVGCRRGWWERIERLENDVSTTFALRPGTEVKLARIEVVEDGVGTLRISLRGEGHGAVLFMCHLESERCVQRVAEADAAIIRWPDAGPGTYAVWVDGYGTAAAAAEAQPLSLTARW